VRLTTVALFGAGYVLGSRAGRERYEQLRALAHGATERFETSGARQRLEAYGSRLEAYSSRARPAPSPARSARRRSA
jgi:hypothetical protein